jgi:hypothetical protein
MSYVETRTNAAQAFYHHFLYDEDMTNGKLVRLSGDLKVSHLAHDTGDVVWPGDADDNVIGICRQNKVNAVENTSDTDLVDVELFGHYRAVAEVTAPAGNYVIGQKVTLQSGAIAMCIKAATSGNTAVFLVP